MKKLLLLLFAQGACRGNRLAAGEILPPFLFHGLYLTVKMVYYKCEVFYE